MLHSDTLLEFPPNLSAQEDLSAIAVLNDQYLIMGGDEGHEIDVLKSEQNGLYCLHHKLVLVEDRDQDEVDLEDICCVGLTCYAVGSHSRKRKKIKSKKSYAENRERLYAQPQPEPTRAVLFQLEVDPDTLIPAVQKQFSLLDIIGQDLLLQQFMEIPSKENGIDIEGLAIKNEKLFVGFRSPVLRDNYVPILVVSLSDVQDYELRFVQMGGRGIRAMTETEDGFLILGGPPGDGDSSYDLYYWTGKDMIPGKDIAPVDALQKLGTLPPNEKGKAEGLALMAESDQQFQVLILYDGIQGGNPTLYTLDK